MVKRSRDTATLAGVIYFTQGFLGISSIALPLYLRHLSWSIKEIAVISSLAAFPWLLKIFFGLVSDSYPVFGYRRKTYLFIFSLLASIGWGFLAALPRDPLVIFLAMFLTNLGFAATDVITDGFIVEHCTEQTGPFYQAVAWASRGTGAVLSGFISGWLAIHWPPQQIFMLTMGLPLIVCLCAVLLLEKRSEQALPSIGRQLWISWGFLIQPPLWIFALILFFLSASASFGIPLFFHMQETLHFHETFLGFLSSLGWAGAVLGAFLYGRYLKKISLQKILITAILLNTVNILGTLLIGDQRSAMIFVFLGGISACLVMLPIVTTAAIFTRHTKVEGTLFAMMMTALNLGQILFGYAGGMFFHLIGFVPLILMTAGTSLTGLLILHFFFIHQSTASMTHLDRRAEATALEIARCLKQAGYAALFAGGCVRDFLMQKPAQDFDIATSALPEEVEKLFPKTVPVGKQFGVMLVIQDGRKFEVATFRKEGGYADGRHPSNVEFTDAKEDARRRDFTVNGLFYDPFEKKVLDFIGGVDDLNKKVIRAIGNPRERFEEDKLRLLRAVRFAANLGFSMDPETWQAVKDKASEINQVSPERVRDELVKIFTREHPEKGLLLLSESGLLQKILPEIEAMKGVEQPKDYHPEGDVFIHTRLLLEKLQNPSAVLAFAALLHDVGKPPTMVIREGKPTFYEHAHVGAEMSRDIMRRLRFPNDEIGAVSECVENHMKFADVQKMRSGKLKQFMSRLLFKTELELHRIDCMSCHGMLDNYYFLRRKIEEFQKEELKPKPWLTGHDVLAVGIPASPKIKEILEEAYTLQLEAAFEKREDALAWLKRKAGK